MPHTGEIPEPPFPLRDEGLALWRDTLRAFADWDPHHCATLAHACYSHQQAIDFAAQIAADGATVEGNGKRLKAHPLAAALDKAVKRYAALMRELALDARPADSRPPRIAGRY